MSFNFKTASPIPLVDCAGWDTGTKKEQERWHKYRNHAAESETDPHWVDYTITGSAVSTLFGEGFSTILSTWHEKKGNYKKPEPSAETQWIFDFGHLAEEVSAQLFAKKTGYTVFNDTTMYQHGAYPWAVADMDRKYVRDDGEEGILECKTTSFSNREKWLDGHWPKGYELQLRFYMAVGNIDHGALCCFWGNGANDFAYYEIERDLDIEKEIFEKAFEFIESLKNNIPPDVSEVMSEKAADELKAIFNKSDATLGKVELPSEQTNLVKAYKTYTDKISELNNEVKSLERKRSELICPVLAIMEKHPAAYIETADEIYDISYKSNSPTKRISYKDVKKDAPEIADKLESLGLVKESITRPFKVKVIPKK